MAASEWQARIEGALNAQFKQPEGGSRPGADYAVGLKRGDETRRIIVRAYLGGGVSAATRRNTNYQAQTVLGYVLDRLAAGWSPDEGSLPAVTILDPRPGQPVPAPPARGLFTRLFGR